MTGVVLIEREGVLATVRDAMAAALDGRGSTILVQGAPGSGKTTILQTVLDEASRSGALVTFARAGELEQNMPWNIVRSLIRSPAAASPSSVGPVAGAVLGLGGGRVTDDVAAFFELAELCLALASERPVVLAVDDAHWADHISVRFLVYLAARLPDVPLTLILGARQQDPRRPEELTTLAGRDDVLAVQLEPLTRSGTAELVSSRVPHATEEIVDACHRASGGNLFLLVELTREIAALGTTVVPEAIYDLEVGGVDRAVARRLAAVGPAAISLARAIAVLGQGARLADAAALAELTYADAARAADALRVADLLAAADEHEPGLAFGHPLLRAAVRRSIPPGERSLLHLAAARRLHAEGGAPDRVGAHLLASEPGDDPWVRDRLVAAADLALDAGAPAAGVALLQRAAAERLGSQDPSLLARLGRAALPVDPQFAEGPLRAALRATPDPVARVEIALTLAVALQVLSRTREATHLLDSLDAELAQASAPRRTRLRVQAEALAQSYFDPHTRGLRTARLPQLTAELDGSCPEELLIHMQRAIDVVDRGPADLLRELAELAWADGRLERVAGGLENPNIMWIPYMRLYVDDYAWTIGLMQQWVQRAMKRGSSVHTAFAHALLSHAQYRAGDLRDAEASATTAWDLARQLGPTFPGWWLAMTMLAQAQLAAGRPDAAHELLGAHGVLDGQPPTKMLMPAPRVVRAETLLAVGERERAAEELLACWRWIESEDAISPGGWWFPTALVDALVALGRNDEALVIAQTWLARTEAFGAPATVGQAQRSIGLAIGKAEGLPWLERAETTLAASPARAEHARALLEVGAARRRLGQRVRARDPLKRALDLATRCGAAPAAERARVELLAAGGRPRRDVLDGPDSLTASERRVVTLAADGRSNREIASGLFISRKTVERHLTNAYAKLGVNDRNRLAAVLSAQERKLGVPTRCGGAGAA